MDISRTICPDCQAPMQLTRATCTEGETVNVRIPLALVRTGVKIAAILPERVTHKLSAIGIDLGKLSELDADELTAALSDLEMDVDSDTGEGVRVCCE